jgi:hypothetical protein
MSTRKYLVLIAATYLLLGFVFGRITGGYPQQLWTCPPYPNDPYNRPVTANYPKSESCVKKVIPIHEVVNKNILLPLSWFPYLVVRGYYQLTN